MIVILFIKKALGFIDGTGHIGALFGDKIGVEGVEQLPESFVVASERAQGIGTASEGNQAHAVSFQAADEVVNAQPGTLQPVGAEVFR